MEALSILPRPCIYLNRYSSKMTRSAIFGAIGSATVAVALFFTPLISCGCLEPWHSFLAAAGVNDWQDRSNLTESVIEKAVRTRYIGQPISEMAQLLQDKSVPTSCRMQAPHTFDCDFWLMAGIAQSAGFQIKAVSAANGSVTAVSVSRARSLFGFRI